MSIPRLIVGMNGFLLDADLAGRGWRHASNAAQAAPFPAQNAAA